MNEKSSGIWKYFIIVITVLLVAGLGSLFVNLGLDWFKTLTTPERFVPDWLIGVVWAVIYLTTIIIVCLWVRKRDLPKSTIVLLILNGIFNILWCLLFFTLNNTLLGLVAIVFNLIMAYILIRNIYKSEPIYAYVMAIYPAWVSIAICLNLALWILN